MAPLFCCLVSRGRVLRAGLGPWALGIFWQCHPERSSLSRAERGKGPGRDGTIPQSLHAFGMTDPIEILVSRLPHGEGLPLPARATPGAAGMDIVAAVEV